MSFICGKYEVVWFIGLEDYVYFFDIVFCVFLILFGFKIVEIENVFKVYFDVGNVMGDFVSDEGFVVNWVFMVEKDVVICEYVISFVVVYCNLIVVKFGDIIR